MSAIKSWREEKRSAYLYREIAKNEKDLVHQKLFHDLANEAEKQASIWAKTVIESGKKIPEKYFPDLRARFVAQLIKVFGTQRLRAILSAMKIRGMSIYYGAHIHEAVATALPSHEGRHKSMTTAGNLRAAVFGINDGLISNVSLILGVAGAQADQHFIVLSGVAGLLAGACSMAAGEYISMRSQTEFYEYQINLERDELDEYPEEEARELALIYEARGMSATDAAILAKNVIKNPDKALDTLAREELGLNPDDLGSPIGAAISSFVSFAIGATIPLVPFLFGKFSWNMPISILLTSLSLLTVGAVMSLFTNVSAIKSALRMLFIGAIAGSLTYGIGSLIGVSV
jgi:VIT1/CCC1 family predicted Fe2+/Mn2+ transporter